MGSVGQVPKAAQRLGQPPTVSKAANTSAVSLPATSPLCMQTVPLAGQRAHYNACRGTNSPSLTGQQRSLCLQQKNKYWLTLAKPLYLNCADLLVLLC